jgi:hypothetical protein
MIEDGREIPQAIDGVGADGVSVAHAANLAGVGARGVVDRILAAVGDRVEIIIGNPQASSTQTADVDAVPIGVVVERVVLDDAVLGIRLTVPISLQFTALRDARIARNSSFSSILYRIPYRPRSFGDPMSAGLPVKRRHHDVQDRHPSRRSVPHLRRAQHGAARPNRHPLAIQLHPPSRSRSPPS